MRVFPNVVLSLTAANMLLTCRAVYELCQQMRYRSVDLVASDENASEVRRSRFLRTVLRQPKLGELVHELAIGDAPINYWNLLNTHWQTMTSKHWPNVNSSTLYTPTTAMNH